MNGLQTLQPFLAMVRRFPEPHFLFPPKIASVKEGPLQLYQNLFFRIKSTDFSCTWDSPEFDRKQCFRTSLKFLYPWMMKSEHRWKSNLSYYARLDFCASERRILHPDTSVWDSPVFNRKLLFQTILKFLYHGWWHSTHVKKTPSLVLHEMKIFEEQMITFRIRVWQSGQNLTENHIPDAFRDSHFHGW